MKQFWQICFFFTFNSLILGAKWWWAKGRDFHVSKLSKVTFILFHKKCTPNSPCGQNKQKAFRISAQNNGGPCSNVHNHAPAMRPHENEQIFLTAVSATPPILSYHFLLLLHKPFEKSSYQSSSQHSTQGQNKFYNSQKCIFCRWLQFPAQLL